MVCVRCSGFVFDSFINTAVSVCVRYRVLFVGVFVVYLDVRCVCVRCILYLIVLDVCFYVFDGFSCGFTCYCYVCLV